MTDNLMRIFHDPKKELWMVYRRGWKHGACFNAMAPELAQHDREDFREAYVRGYSDGRAAANQAGTAEAGRLGYDASRSMLRTAVPK